MSKLGMAFISVTSATVGAVAWTEYQNHLLWTAAQQHYVDRLTRDPSRLAAIIRLCETERKKREIESYRSQAGVRSEWQVQRPILRRGIALVANAGLEWLRLYAFYVTFTFGDVSDGNVIDVVAICRYNPEFPSRVDVDRI